MPQINEEEYLEMLEPILKKASTERLNIMLSGLIDDQYDPITKSIKLLIIAMQKELEKRNK